VLLDAGGRTDAEILAPVVDRALDESGLSLTDIGVMGTASSEYLNGVVGGVMGAFDALPGWPPLAHSHLEGDGAFALYESWVRLLAGESKAALVCAFSRPLAEDKSSVLTMQLDPYLVAPLAPRPSSLAAIQARVLLDSGVYTEDDFASVVRDRRGGHSKEELMGLPYRASPLRELDCSTVCSGAAAVVLAVDELASGSSRRPAWIMGMEHRIESQALGRRDLSVSSSTRVAAQALGVPGTKLDVAEFHAPFSHQELILRDAIGAGEIGSVNPSGGALPADPIMVTGLIRMGYAAQAVMHGDAERAVGHATNGPCLQQNLLCLIDADGAAS
jgi:acetyl-CoA acetyltransferase